MRRKHLVVEMETKLRDAKIRPLETPTRTQTQTQTQHERRKRKNTNAKKAQQKGTKERKRERKRALRGVERNKERVLLVILTISFVFFDV